VRVRLGPSVSETLAATQSKRNTTPLIGGFVDSFSASFIFRASPVTVQRISDERFMFSS
jgi:hypothetical protein